MRQLVAGETRTFALPCSQISSNRGRNTRLHKRNENMRVLQMHIERQQQSDSKPTTKIHPTTPICEDDARARAARLAESADVLIDRILSGDSREFLAANRQTGGE